MGNTKRLLQLAVIPQQLWNSQNPYLQEQNPGLQEQNPDLLMSLQQQQALVKLLRVRIQLLQQHLNSLANLDLQKIILGNPEIHLPQIRLLNPEYLRLKTQNPDLLQQQLKGEQKGKPCSICKDLRYTWVPLKNLCS